MRHCTLHQSLVRPILLMGAERSLTILNGTLCAILIFGMGLSLATTVITVGLCAFIQIGLVLLAKSDAQMVLVLKRHLSYEGYYPAASSVLSSIKPTTPTLPTKQIL